jgi:hypothetical protein
MLPVAVSSAKLVAFAAAWVWTQAACDDSAAAMQSVAAAQGTRGGIALRAEKAGA